MAQVLKILGQSNPAAATATDLYTVPGATTAAVSSIVICNQGSTATTFRVSLSVTGAVTTAKDYIYYDVPISGNDTFIATVGLTMGATDKMRVYAGNGNLSFSAYGGENA